MTKTDNLIFNHLGALLDVRNLIEKQLTKHPDIKFGGSAGVATDGSSADVDILIDGDRFNIRIQPRNG